MTGQRMFVAVVPPLEAVEDLEEFLAPREGMRWIDPQQWHMTLAFLASVPEHRIDDLIGGLAAKVSRYQPFRLRLAGAGAFPDPIRASVLWLGVRGDSGCPGAGASEATGHVTELTALAGHARRVANSVGAPPDGRAFVPHLTVARPRRPIEATKWLRVLDTYTGPVWEVSAIALIESHLGEGPHRRPRYERVADLPLGPSARD